MLSDILPLGGLMGHFLGGFQLHAQSSHRLDVLPRNAR